MKISELAKKTGVSASALRYYEAEGLLPPAARSGGKRNFAPEMVEVVLLIRLAQRAGFRVSEIRTLLSGFTIGRQPQVGGVGRSFINETSPSKRWKTLARSKIQEIEQMKKTIRDMEKILVAGLKCRCLRLQDCRLIRS